MITQLQIKRLVVNLVTGGNLLMGVGAILAASRGHGLLAVLFLLLGMLFDALDGLLARYWQVFSKVGAELDSLADLTSFIIANTVLIFFWFDGHIGLGWQILAGTIFCMGGAFRLARFNVYPTSGGLFQGLPTTGAALLIAAIYLTHPNLDPRLGLVCQALLGGLMVSDFPYPKLGQLRRLPPIAYGALFGFALWSFAGATALGCLLYLISGPILACRGMAPVKRS